MDNLIAVARETLDLTQQDLADKLGVNRSTVSRWEKKGSVSKFVAPIIEKMLKGKRNIAATGSGAP